MSNIFRSGFVGIVGRPNVGKSTLLNALVGEKVAITSAHPQTTRRRIAGIRTTPESQIIFLDTPGWQRPEHDLGRAMFEATKSVIEDADVLLVLVDGRAGLRDTDEELFEQVKRHGRSRPTFLGINKVDIARKLLILPLIDRCAKTEIFREIFPISALNGYQVDELLAAMAALLPEGPHWYEPGQKTDQSAQDLTAEFIREPILAATHQEVPHSVAVVIDRMVEGEKVLEIDATLLVERQGQKAILIGKGGLMLKRIGETARRDIEKLLGRHVFLNLWVKVAENWRSDPRWLRELGYRT